MRRVVSIVFVLLVIAGSWWIYSQDRKAAPVAPAGIITEPVRRGPIEALVSATGSLAAERVQPLTFNTTGKVTEVPITEGAVVSANQVAARVDTQDLELALTQAQAALQVNEASLARARKAPSQEEIAAARAALASAKANLQDLPRGPSARDLELAKLAVDQAKNTLYGAQGNRDATNGNPYSSGGAKATAESQVLNAEIGVKIAEINRDKLYESYRASSATTAESQVAQAESTLARLLASPSVEDVAVAEAQVAQARVGVEIARNRLQNTTLTFPFSGELVSWNLHVGDNVAPALVAGTLVDTSHYRIDVNIDETEISQIAIGQQVRITLDAFPDTEFEGRVGKIDLIGTSTQGIVNYGVRVELSSTQLPIRPLMTAAINIIVDRKDGVLMVANRAVRRDKAGKYVEVLRNNAVARVPVDTGVSNEDSTEITSGLAEGDEVIVSKPRQNLLSGGAFGG